MKSTKEMNQVAENIWIKYFSEVLVESALLTQEEADLIISTCAA